MLISGKISNYEENIRDNNININSKKSSKKNLSEDKMIIN